MARLSNLRYHSPREMVLPSIRKKTEARKVTLVPSMIPEESADPDDPQDFSLKNQIGHWSILRCEGSIPRSCESAEILVVDCNLVLCAGQSQARHSELKILDLRTRKWKIMQTAHTPAGRLGHSVVSYKHKLVMFGGWSSQEAAERHTYSKLLVLSLHSYSWDHPKSTFGPTPRKYHAAAQLGRSMVLFGGVDYRSIIQDDLYVLDVKEKTWKVPDLCSTVKPGRRSHCTLTPVFPQTLKALYNFTIEKVPRVKDEYSLPNSAFYLFGGIDESKAPCNSLHALVVKNGKMMWSEVKCSGVPPCPRFSHTACAIHSSLFIYGGRNDMICSKTQVALADLFVLNVKNFKWDRVEVFGSIPDGRWAHGMTTYNTSVLVFGGISYHEFMPAHLYVLETERVEAEKRIQIELRNYE